MIKYNQKFDISYETEIEKETPIDIFNFVLCEVYSKEFTVDGKHVLYSPDKYDNSYITGKNLLMLQQDEYSIEDFFNWINIVDNAEVAYEIADFIIVKTSDYEYHTYTKLSNEQVELLMEKLNNLIVKYNINCIHPVFHRLLVHILKKNYKDIQSNLFISNMTINEISE